MKTIYQKIVSNIENDTDISQFIEQIKSIYILYLSPLDIREKSKINSIPLYPCLDHSKYIFFNIVIVIYVVRIFLLMIIKLNVILVVYHSVLNVQMIMMYIISYYRIKKIFGYVIIVNHFKNQHGKEFFYVKYVIKIVNLIIKVYVVIDVKVIIINHVLHNIVLESIIIYF